MLGHDCVVVMVLDWLMFLPDLLGAGVLSVLMLRVMSVSMSVSRVMVCVMSVLCICLPGALVGV